MVTEAKTKIHKVGSRHTIYLRNDLVNDSSFPFEANQSLVVKIEGERLVIEKAKHLDQERESEGY